VDTAPGSEEPEQLEQEPEVAALTPLGDLGVTVALPEEATVQVVPDHPNRQVDVWIEGFLVRFVHVEVTPPASLDDALSGWLRDDAEVWARGTGPGGAFYAGATFRVRVGHSRGGRHVHRLQDVSRAYGALGVGDGATVRCTGYVEAGTDRDGAPPPAILPLVDVCASMSPVEATR